MSHDLMTRRAFSRDALLTVAAVSMSGLPRAAGAQQNYPNRPVRFVLPFAAGGVADITSRIAADKLGEVLKQRFVIENQPGPGGIAAARSVLSAQPDGYTIGLVTNGTSISVAIYKSLPFDPVKDFVPISTLGYFDLVFATNSQSQYKTLQDFIAAAQKEPGKLNVGTINVGGTQNLAAELFKSSANLNFQIVPYRTTPDVIVALLRNDIALMVDFYAAMKGAISDNKIRAVATSGPERTAYLKAIPTAAEAGVPGYDVTSWNGVFAPHGAPQEVVDTLNKAMHDVLVIPEVKQKYLDLGVEAKASTPDVLMARMKGDIDKWAAVIEKAGIPKQ